jgi:hypothetical protein
LGGVFPLNGRFRHNLVPDFTHYLQGRDKPTEAKRKQNMKQFIGLIRFGALTAASAVAHQKTLATKILDSQLPREGELVLLAIDGTVVAREINLVPRAGGYGSIPLERYRRVSNRPFARVFRSR